MSTEETISDKAPLLGFVVKESDSKIHVRVSGGDWVIRREDIDSMSDWENHTAVDIEGRAVQVMPKAGATLGFLQSVKVTAGTGR